MSTTIINTFLSFFIFYITLELTKRKFEIPSVITRKIAHMGSALLVILFYLSLSQKEFILATSVFTIIFIFSYLTKFLQSIHINEHKTIGELIYPLALIVLGLFFYNNSFIMISSIATLGFADAISGLYNLKNKKNTIGGSILFLAITFIILLTSYIISYNEFTFWLVTKIIFISILVTLAEHYANYGLDNFTVPLSCAILLSLLF